MSSIDEVQPSISSFFKYFIAKSSKTSEKKPSDLSAEVVHCFVDDR